MGATIVDGLDTLYIMGFHDEYKQGRDWIAENLDFDLVSLSTHNLINLIVSLERKNERINQSIRVGKD